MERIKYSKPVLSRKAFIKESGYPAAYVNRAIHHKDADLFTIRTSDAPNAKVMIDTAMFEHYRAIGEFR